MMQRKFDNVTGDFSMGLSMSSELSRAEIAFTLLVHLCASASTFLTRIEEKPWYSLDPPW